MRRPLLARVAAVTFALAAAIACGAVAFAPTGCAQRTCEGSTGFYGGAPGEGELIDENTWESSPADGTWLDYPGERAWFFFPSVLAHRRVANVIVYISANPHPNVTHPGDVNSDPASAQFTIGSGNVAEVTLFPDQALNPNIVVHNDTCAQFYVRVVVEAYPLPPASAADAGTDGGDASSDAPLEADALTDGASE